MTAESLVQLGHSALAITGVPTFAAPDEAQGGDSLRYFPAAEGQPDCWALAPAGGESGVSTDVMVTPGEIDLDDILPVDTLFAAELIKGHLRAWLAARGWQVQMKMAREMATWRLADCLAVTEGGGDRLDDHYPAGDDELAVLCEAVVMLARHGMG